MLSAAASAPILSDAEFARQYELHFERTVRALRRICGSRWDLEGIAQDGWLRAWAGRAQFRGDSSFLTWISRIVYLQFLQQRRKKYELQIASDAPEPSCSVDYDTAIYLEQLLSRTSTKSSNRLLSDMQGELQYPLGNRMRTKLVRDRKLVRASALPKYRRQALLRILRSL
jgi:DNA-directed RNA polymerase specialized sigma24 family protein